LFAAPAGFVVTTLAMPAFFVDL